MKAEKQADLKSMTDDALKQFAIEMGVDLNGTEKRADIERLIVSAVVKKDEGFVATEVNDEVMRKAFVIRSRRLAEKDFLPKLSGRRVTVNVAKTKEAGASVILGLNGVIYRVQTGVDVDLPEEVVQACLTNAKGTSYVTDDSGKISSSYEVSAYPHTVLGPARKRAA